MVAIGFGIGAIAIGLVGILMRRTWGVVTARSFERSTWVGLRRSPAEWTRTTVVIGAAWLAVGITAILIGAFGHA